MGSAVFLQNVLLISKFQMKKQEIIMANGTIPISLTPSVSKQVDSTQQYGRGKQHHEQRQCPVGGSGGGVGCREDGAKEEEKS